jgi:hypothetical protein
MHTKFINIGTPSDRLVEECAEVIQALMKINRFGLDTAYRTNPTNRVKVLDEIEDLELAIKNYKEWVSAQPFAYKFVE